MKKAKSVRWEQRMQNFRKALAQLETACKKADLADKIEQTTLPQQVDLVRFHRIKNPNLIEHIRQHGVEWYHRPD